MKYQTKMIVTFMFAQELKLKKKRRYDPITKLFIHVIDVNRNM